ncbi:MAG TPA: ferritin-like domain-containing protein [Actinomycetota bacterium]|nr:ferritin-like domain-containing protein [Actinomycetota bacterium]
MDGFDLDRYLRASKKVDLEGVAWDRVAEHPLPVDEARCLAYMMDIESHTVVFLRDLLATRAALEPDVTAFLACWVYEELWHGEAFSRFLGEAGYQLGPDREEVRGDAPYPSRIGRNAWIRRKLGGKGYAAHVGTMVGSLLVKDFVALHMTWGAGNELSTLSGYQTLTRRTSHPVLIELLRRIIKDERRHFAFYRAQARMRLDRSPRARRVTRWVMERLWAPVGTGVRPQAETDFVVATLFGDADGLAAAREMDQTIAELPGFDGARLIERARGEAIGRSRPRRAGRTERVAAPLAAFRAS